jgi:phage FluMu protein Com
MSSGLFDLLPELRCRKCRTVDTPLLEARGHLKAACPRCGTFLKFVPQNTPWTRAYTLQLVSPSHHLRTAAREYEVMGWNTLPVNGKQPATKYRAGIPPLETWPDFDGLALPLGSSSNVGVLDFDGGPGLALYRQWKPLLPEGVAVARGGQGLHVYFAHEPTLRTTMLKLEGVKAGEWRGEDALIVLPPTWHASGRHYRWLSPPRFPLPHLPLELHALILGMRPKDHGSSFTAMPSSDTPRPVRDGGRAWLDRALHRASSEGRNNAAYWLSCRLRDGGVPLSDARGVLEQFASSVARGNHPFPVREALGTLGSAYRRAR